MNPKELCSKLKGVIGFPVTPFNDDHSLDLDGHRENVRYMLEQPMCALVAAGGTGELYSLDPDEVRQVVEATIECPKHSSIFDCTSGEVETPPACENLCTYPVKVDGGRVFVEI